MSKPIRAFAAATMILCNTPLTNAQSVAAPCPAGTITAASHADVATVQILSAKDAFLFRIPNPILDLDGGAKTYGVRDQGTDNVCNGVKANPKLKPPMSCAAAVREWNAQGRTNEAAQKLLCDSGVGAGCNPFSYDLQSDPSDANGFFVSPTSLKYETPSGKELVKWEHAQAAQIDPLAVPYFAVPKAITHLGVKMGMIGALINLNDPKAPPVYFIVADGAGSNPIGEFSAKAWQKIAGDAPLTILSRKDAFGKPVDRLWMPKDIPTTAAIIFKNPMKPVAGQSEQIALTADTIQSWIETGGVNAMKTYGGGDEALGRALAARCAPALLPQPPKKK